MQTKFKNREGQQESTSKIFEECVGL